VVVVAVVVGVKEGSAVSELSVRPNKSKKKRKKDKPSEFLTQP
jgi:hypothetical protein